MTLRHAFLLLAVCVLVTSCRKKVHPAKPPVVGSSESGIASWYGYPYHGRRAANGEIYDMEKMTAAHRTLPFDTWVRVRNVANDKAVEVRITDRGPFVQGRIIDLSKAAARAIDLLGPGVARVSLTIISPPPKQELPKTDLYGVQIGAFQDRSRAERLQNDMRERYGHARITLRGADPMLYRVLVGEEPDTASAEELRGKLQADGFNGFVVRLDSPLSTAPDTNGPPQ